MQSPEDLDKLAKDVTSWRNSRRGRTEQMPIKFVQRAFELRKQFKQTEIERKAKIFRYQYKRLGCEQGQPTPVVHKVDLLTPNSLSIDLGSGLRIDCQVGSNNLADVVTTIARSLNGYRDA